MPEHKEPRICAVCVLDENEPVQAEGNSYRIRLFIEDAPDDTHADTLRDPADSSQLSDQ